MLIEIDYYYAAIAHDQFLLNWLVRYQARDFSSRRTATFATTLEVIHSFCG
jgi:hypothetical protein